MRLSMILVWVALAWMAICGVSAEPEKEPQLDALADPDPGRERRQLSSVTNALRLVIPGVRLAARRLTQEVAPAVGSTILKAGNHLALRAAEGLQDTVQVVNEHLVPAIEDHLVQATNAAVPYINRGIDALGVGIQQGAEVVSRSATKGVDQIGRRVLGQRRHHRVKKIANNLKGSITSSLNTIASAITYLSSPDQPYTNSDYHNSNEYRNYYDYRDNYYYDNSANNYDYYTRPDDYPTYRPDRGGDASVPGSEVHTVGQALARMVGNTAYSLSSSVLGQNLTQAVAPLAKSVSKTMSESLPAVSFGDGRIVIDLPGTDNSERTEVPPRSCTTPVGKKGVCQDLGDCPNLILDLTNLRKSVCFKRLFVPGVCCPSEGISVDDDRFPDNQPTTTSTTHRPPPITIPTTQRPTPVASAPSTTKPPEPDRNVHCGVPQVPEFRVVGGKESGRGQWPWMAAVWLHGPKKTEFWCGATLISRRHILTAAHCTKDSRGKTFNPQQFTVRLGDHNIFSTNDDFISKPKTYSVMSGMEQSLPTPHRSSSSGGKKRRRSPVDEFTLPQNDASLPGTSQAATATSAQPSVSDDRVALDRLSTLVSGLIEKLDRDTGTDFSGFHALSSSEEEEVFVPPTPCTSQPDPLDSLDQLGREEGADEDFLRALSDLSGHFHGEEKKGRPAV
ncbi:uncharacterized protein LOC123511126 [Portunus trituberculatus]|uniref:uncharacterized protein LOC123511126 n=1 Tax=Portunus trituberculatus TaxID=210409 RepID=UPI001E1CFD19|nr:uncharacterized protein LOC123511126 [Portunus trituberculatus]